MQVIGFSFTKILAEKKPEFEKGSSIQNNIQFTDISKDKIEMLKDVEPYKVSFKFNLIYKKQEEGKENKETKPEGEVLFEGYILLAMNPGEAKEVQKLWKKKEVAPNLRLPLFNLILKRCTAKALALEEELSLPFHVSIPQLRPQNKQETN